MEKILKNIILVIGIALLLVVEILNVVFVSNLSILEGVDIKLNSILTIFIVLFLVADIYIINMLIKKSAIKIKNKTLVLRIILGIIIVIYVIAQIIWINYRQAKPNADQLTVYEMARGIVEGNLDKVIKEGKTYSSTLENAEYLQCYPQQFTLAFAWSILFRICGSTSLSVIQYFNAVCNGITVLSIYLITTELSKKHKVNKYLAMSLILTFATLPLLSTFIYGDLSSLAFALLSVYFIMKYTSKEKIRYALISAIFMMIAYMLRMNILIFIIATVIYLFIDIISKKNIAKLLVTKVIVMISFILIVMLPSMLIKNYYCNKYNLDKSKKFPVTGYLYMGMGEAISNCGWYNFEYARIHI